MLRSSWPVRFVAPFLLLAFLVAGCGGGGSTEATDKGTPGIDYPVDISKVNVRECPSELFAGDWEVLIEGNEVVAYCGKATGTLNVEGQKPVAIQNGHCDLSPEGVELKGGFINQEFDAPESFRLNLPELRINLGRFHGVGSPVTGDGTYVDPPKGKEEIEVIATGSGRISLVEGFEYKITVVLSDDRTKAKLTAEPVDANDPNWPRVSGSFDCHAEIFRSE
ncbi:MAG: hypothetical protein WBM00_07065 [Solirubrobacterales bacterium]